MKKGTIKFFNEEKNFGFILCDDNDFFFHASALPNDYNPQQDDSVTFELSEQVKGKHKGKKIAVNIQPA